MKRNTDVMRCMMAFVLVGVLMLGQTVVHAAKPIVTESTSPLWRIIDARVSKAGQVISSPEGESFREHQIEAVAQRFDPVLELPEGRFILTLAGFRPARDMPGQKAGLWHLRGTWEIVDRKATSVQRRSRHNPLVTKGELQAILPFNPIEESGAVRASVRLPLLLDRPGTRKIKGYFEGNERFEGIVAVPRNRLPEISAARTSEK